jgi:hypothetical protein
MQAAKGYLIDIGGLRAVSGIFLFQLVLGHFLGVVSRFWVRFLIGYTEGLLFLVWSIPEIGLELGPTFVK